MSTSASVAPEPTPRPPGERMHPWIVFGLVLLVLLWRAPSLGFLLANPDHGYQLSLGRQILLGAFPYVDLMFHYGPLVAFTSAFNLGFLGGVMGETLVCALGYAIAFLLLARVARCRISGAAGWLVPLVGMLLIARFYKWYFWLFQAAILYCLHRHFASPTGSIRWLVIAGGPSGLGGLYRLDLGVVLLVVCTAFALTEGLAGGSRSRALRAAAGTLAAFAIPLIVWLVVLGWAGGAVAIRDYLAATLAGSSGAVAEWSRGVPAFVWAQPFTKESGLSLAHFLLPATYALCGILGFRSGYLRPDPMPGSARCMLATAILGLGLLPQARYRADVQHLLQALPPMLLAASFLLRRGWLASRRLGRPGWTGLRLGIAIYAAILALAAVGLSSRSGMDLARYVSDPRLRWAQLRSGVAPGVGVTTPLGRISLEIQRSTAAGDRILVVPRRACQLYHFAERPMSGLLNMYARGILDGPEWRRRNLEHVREHPPALVVAWRGFPDPAHPRVRELRSSQPELHRYVAARYTRVAYADGPWVILRPHD